MKSRNNKIVIFGATGTVGAYTALYLKECGYNIIAVGHRKSDNGFFEDNNIPYYSVDVSDINDFEQLPIDDIEVVVNLAGMLPARMKGYNPQAYIDINVTGCLNIIRYCIQSNINRIIYSQSISDVGYLCGNKVPISSDSVSKFPINNDHSIYSITKNAAVSMIEHWAAKYNKYYNILRFPNIYLYHPNPKYFVDGEEKWQGYRLMIYKAMKGEPISVWGDPSKVHDVVYVKDCCQIIEGCIKHDEAPNGTYNVGTGIGTTLEDQIKGIVEVFSPKENQSQIQYDPSKPNSTEYVFDMSKTEKFLGYKMKYNYINYLLDFKKEMEMQRFQKLWGKDKTLK